MDGAIAAALDRLDGPGSGAEPSGNESEASLGAERSPGSTRRREGHAAPEVEIRTGRKRVKGGLEAQWTSSDEGGSDSGGERGAFAAGGKDAAFARAFAGILGTPDIGGPSTAPILAASKGLLKRKREEAEGKKGDKEARKLRQEMRLRGYVPVLAKGEEPEQDAKEKALMKLATRGVVRLFNAVSKAQTVEKEASDGKHKGKTAASMKSSFLAELRGQAVQRPPLGASQASLSTLPGPRAGDTGSRPKEEKSGWAVFQDGFAGMVQGSGTKLKDWDKALGPQDSSDGLGEELGDDAGSSSSDDDI